MSGWANGCTVIRSWFFDQDQSANFSQSLIVTIAWLLPAFFAINSISSNSSFVRRFHSSLVPTSQKRRSYIVFYNCVHSFELKPWKNVHREQVSAFYFQVELILLTAEMETKAFHSFMKSQCHSNLIKKQVRLWSNWPRVSW